MPLKTQVCLAASLPAVELETIRRRLEAWLPKALLSSARHGHSEAISRSVVVGCFFRGSVPDLRRPYKQLLERLSYVLHNSIALILSSRRSFRAVRAERLLRR